MVFGWFKRKKKPRKVPPQKQSALTEKMIISMVADGLSFDEIRQIYPEIEEQELKRIVKKGLGKVGMFLDY